MEYIIIGLLVLVIILVIIVLLKNNGSNAMIERVGRLETDLTKEIGEFKVGFSTDLRNDFDKLNEKIELRLNMINERVITEAERCIYFHMLEKSLEGRVSGFVRIGTDETAILLCPA